MHDPPTEYDVFISHASEDKASFVDPLVQSLDSIGVRVWYDEFVLTVGDSLMRKIDHGLSRSKFGIVVISPDFLEKKWTEYELRGLAAREMDGDKIVLPIWHNVSRDKIVQYSPPLADKKALMTEKLSVDQISHELVRVIRPDIHQRFVRMMMLKAMENQTLRSIPLSKIVPSKPRHASLPPHQLARIFLIHAMTDDVLPMSLAKSIYGFRCDLEPEREIRVWERIAACYWLATKGMKFSKRQRTEIFSFFLSASMSPVGPSGLSRLKSFPARKRQVFLDLWETNLAEYDTLGQNIVGQ